LTSREQFPKQAEQTLVTDEGMQMDSSDEHPKNAADAKTATRLSASKVTAESAVQSEKHFSEISASDDGIQMDVSETHFENAARPTPKSREPTSNVRIERSSHDSKQRSEICSTDEGIQIDSSDDSEKSNSLSIARWIPVSNVTLAMPWHR
jgi:hypothetical protein